MYCTCAADNLIMHQSNSQHLNDTRLGDTGPCAQLPHKIAQVVHQPCIGDEVSDLRAGTHSYDTSGQSRNGAFTIGSSHNAFA